MTLPATSRRAGPFAGTGVSTAFPFSFSVTDSAEVQVAVSDAVGEQTILASGYTVAVNVDQTTSPGGSVTYTLAVGSTLVITSALPYDQTLALPGGGNFSSRAIERNFDRVIKQVQQLAERVGRALTLPITSSQTGDLAPEPLTLLGWDGAGQRIINYAMTVLAGVMNSDAVFYLRYLTLGAVTRLLRERLGEKLSIGDFGGNGDGTNQTAALLATIAYVNDNYSGNNYKPRIHLPAGDYLFDAVALNSLRGFVFLGEGTADSTKRKTVWKYAGPGAEDYMLMIKSCANTHFKGILFDINNAESMGNIILFAANDSTVAAPLNRFSNNFIYFTDCSVRVQPAIVTKPVNDIWLKCCSEIFFKRCGIYCDVKFGADTDLDPDTGLATVADGLCIQTVFDGCYINGNFIREKSYHLRMVDSQLYVTTKASSLISTWQTSGGKVTGIESIENCLWDPSAVASYSGTLVQGGDSASVNSSLSIRNCQLAGKETLVRVPRGSIELKNNRLIAFGGSTSNVAVRMEVNSGGLEMSGNSDDEYLAGNTLGNPIQARLLVDSRTSKRLPIVVAAGMTVEATLPAAGAYVGVLSQSYKFGGHYVRISYSVTVQHKDGGTVRHYSARVALAGTALADTGRRISLKETDEYGVLSADVVVFIDAQDDPKTIQLQVNQTAGAVFGVVQAGVSSVATTSWVVEVLQS